MLSADFADIEQIDISLDGAEYTIASEKKGNDRTYFYGEEELDIAMFQSYDGSHCLAVVDGAPVSLVTRTSAVDLIEAVHAIVLD